MRNFYYNGLLLLLLAALVSCKNERNDYTAYFGGVVDNPTTRYVIFSKDDKVLDTIPLDEKNRFYIKFDSLTPGLYSFRHEPDYHYVYFDRNDSLMVSINGINFDESIVFSGRGEAKNNFLMDMYLLNEKDRKQSADIYELDVKTFLKRTDSVYKTKKAFYEQRKKSVNWNDGFDFYAKSRLNLNNNTKKERYPYLHAMRTGENIREQLPKDYYSFRKDIDFNDKRLTFFSPFVRYLTAMLNNTASAKKYNGATPEDKSLHENIEKLRVADSIFTDKRIKNDVLDNIAFAYILEDQNIANNEQFLDEYVKLSDKKEENDIKKMGRAIKLLKPGNKIPQIALVDTKNKNFIIDGDIKKETVIFFWTACARLHLDMMGEKIKLLKEEHPNVNFIAINVDEEKEWKRMIGEYNLPDSTLLHASNFNELKFKWVFTKINRTIILNPDGTIKNAFTNLMDSKFTEYLR